MTLLLSILLSVSLTCVMVVWAVVKDRCSYFKIIREIFPGQREESTVVVLCGMEVWCGMVRHVVGVAVCRLRRRKGNDI